MTYQQAVKQVREGKAQLHYDNGDLEGLRKFLKEAFPKDDTVAIGCHVYYYRWLTNVWGCSKKEEYNLTTVKLSEIMREVKTTKERIQAAYDKAGQEGKDILKELFPEYIVEDNSVDVRSDILDFVWKASVGKYANKSFWLNKEYNWEVKSFGEDVILIPTKK